LDLPKPDGEYLEKVGSTVLGKSSVAATNARRLTEMGLDAVRIDKLIPWGAAASCQGLVFKKVEADPESPDNYGLFVRKNN
jgi:hypothetical protein